MVRLCTPCLTACISYITGFPQSWKVMEKFVVMESHEKVMENDKNMKSHGKVRNLP